ncbi:translocation/assembly module TamB domain-containing protein [Vibrio sp.]|uniref:translocation/assembly module TamB domain-containing protein n=1 Tax=Vibrio sp. TaxID=678 RepID=UPI003D1507A5
MKTILSLLPLLVAMPVAANELPPLSAPATDSPHKLFLTSEKDNRQFDSWKIDSGYAYSVFDNIDLYFAARINNDQTDNQSGFLSGVSYQITPRVSVNSAVRSLTVRDESSQQESSAMAAEVSSRVRLTDNMDLHATLDYREWQQGVEVGLGFRF